MYESVYHQDLFEQATSSGTKEIDYWKIICCNLCKVLLIPNNLIFYCLIIQFHLLHKRMIRLRTYPSLYQLIPYI